MSKEPPAWLKKLDPEAVLKRVERFAAPSRVSIFPVFGKKLRGSDLIYATFTARIFTITMDMLLIYLVLGPVFQLLSEWALSSFDAPVVNARIQQLSRGMEIGTVTPAQFMNELVAMGVFTKILIDLVAQLLICGVVIVGCFVKFGRTPAMYLFRLRVVDADTLEAPSLRQHIIRYIAGVFAIAPMMLGFLWIIIDRRNQGVHDKCANTLVLRTPLWKAGEPFPWPWRRKTPSPVVVVEEEAEVAPISDAPEPEQAALLPKEQEKKEE